MIVPQKKSEIEQIQFLARIAIIFSLLSIGCSLLSFIF